MIIVIIIIILSDTVNFSVFNVVENIDELLKYVYLGLLVAVHGSMGKFFGTRFLPHLLRSIYPFAFLSLLFYSCVILSQLHRVCPPSNERSLSR